MPPCRPPTAPFCLTAPLDLSNAPRGAISPTLGTTDLNSHWIRKLNTLSSDYLGTSRQYVNLVFWWRGCLVWKVQYAAEVKQPFYKFFRHRVNDKENPPTVQM